MSVVLAPPIEEQLAPEVEAPEIDELGEALLGGADYIDKHGWCTGSLFHPDGSACLLGAVGYAAGVLILEQRPIPGFSHNTLHHLADGVTLDDWRQFCERVQGRLGPFLPSACEHGAEFNDGYANSAADVTALLRRAARNVLP